MKFKGRISFDGKFWLVEIPEIDAMTQGRSLEEAQEMATDLVENFINDPNFKASISIKPTEEYFFDIIGTDPQKMRELFLKRKI